MSAAAAFRRRDVNASDAVAELLHPNMGYREKLRRRGVEPKDFERANRLQLKKQQAEQRERKQLEAAAQPEAFKLTKFKTVQPRVFQEKSRVQDEEPPKRHVFLRRGASSSALQIKMKNARQNASTVVRTTKETELDSARATARGSSYASRSVERPKRVSVKPPIPSRHELEALNEQLTRLHHKDKPDFVTTNAWEVIKAAPARPRDDSDSLESKHNSFGRIPEYLLQRKEKWAHDEEERRRNLPDPDCPPGMVPLLEDERVSTLSVLTQSLEEAQQQVYRLPLRIETPSQIRRKNELLARLQEIEDAIKVFCQPKVYVAKPVDESSSPGKPLQPSQSSSPRGRRSRRPSQSSSTVAA